MQHLTVRNIPDELSEALEREKRAKGQSLNQTVIDLLTAALGIDSHRSRRNGLAALAGTWNEQDYRDFCQAVASLDTIDEEMWR